MKKFFILLGLIVLLNGCVYAADNAREPIKASVSMSDLTVFSGEKNLFGLKDKEGNIIVEPQYKKLIRLGDSSWIVLKKINTDLSIITEIILYSLNTDTLTEFSADT